MNTPAQASATKPLAGIRILDLSRLLPGPYCTQLLVDLGADVIKIETPLAGDYARMAPKELGFEGVFEAVNRGKRSIAVDYRRSAGRDIVLALAQTADVFLESSLPGQMERRGLGEADVRAVNPEIVYCSLSGYGQAGPDRDKPAHDIDYLATSGVLSLLGSPGQNVAAPGLQLADISAGMLAALRILAALTGRQRGAGGSYLDVAVIDAAVSWLSTLGSSTGRRDDNPGALSGAYPCYTTYQAGDGRWLAVGALEPQFWASFCEGIGREDLISSQFDGGVVRDVAAIIATRIADEWVECLPDEACVARVNLPVEALADPQVRARQQGVPREGTAPGLGDDTNEVLAAAGIDAAEFRGLEQAGVVAGKQSPERAARAARLGAMLSRRAGRQGVAAA